MHRPVIQFCEFIQMNNILITAPKYYFDNSHSAINVPFHQFILNTAITYMEIMTVTTKKRQHRFNYITNQTIIVNRGRKAIPCPDLMPYNQKNNALAKILHTECTSWCYTSNDSLSITYKGYFLPD